MRVKIPKFDLVWFCVSFMAGIIIATLGWQVCVKSVTRELTKVQYELQTVENQRNILSDIIRCHTDEEIKDCDILDVANDFLPAIGCSEDSLSNWTYCY